MATEDGWPTLADVHAAVLRVDGRLQALAERQDAQAAALAQHRADDRRELDGLADRIRAERSRVTGLYGRERWMAGGLALLTLLVVVGVPTTVAVMT